MAQWTMTGGPAHGKIVDLPPGRTWVDFLPYKEPTFNFDLTSWPSSHEDIVTYVLRNIPVDNYQIVTLLALDSLTPEEILEAHSHIPSSQPIRTSL